MAMASSNPSLLGGAKRGVDLDQWIKDVQQESDRIAERTLGQLVHRETQASDVVKQWILEPTLCENLTTQKQRASFEMPSIEGEPDETGTSSRWSQQFSREVQAQKRAAAHEAKSHAQPTRSSHLRDGDSKALDPTQHIEFRHKRVDDKRQDRLMSRDVNKAPRQPEVRRSRTEKPRQGKRHAQPMREIQPTDEEVEENKAEALALQLEVARLKAQVEQEAREAAKAAEAAQAAEEVELQRQELEALTRQREELRKKERCRLLEAAGKQAQKMYVRRRLPLLQARVAQWRQLKDDTKLEMKRRDVLRRWRHLKQGFGTWAARATEQVAQRQGEEEARDAARLAWRMEEAERHDTRQTLSKCFLAWDQVHRAERAERQLREIHEKRRGRIHQVLQHAAVQESVTEATAAVSPEDATPEMQTQPVRQQNLPNAQRATASESPAPPDNGERTAPDVLLSRPHERSDAPPPYISTNPYGAPPISAGTRPRSRPKVVPAKTLKPPSVDRRQLAMLKREAERQKRREELEAKYAAKEAARLQEAEAAQAREVAAVEEEKRRRSREKRLTKQAKLQAEEEARVAKAIFGQQVALARMHASRSAILRGWSQWLRAVAAAEAQVLLADQTHAMGLFRRGLAAFGDAVMHTKTMKALAGGNILHWCLRYRAERFVRAALQGWQRGFKAWGGAMSCIARNRRRVLLRKNVRSWYHGAVRARAATAARKMRVEKIVWGYCSIWATRDCFQSWVRWIANTKIEHEQEMRKDEMRRKASSWLVDYRKGKGKSLAEARK